MRDSFSEGSRDGGFDLHRMSVQQVRLILPLPNSIDDRIIETCSESFDDADVSYGAGGGDKRMQLDLTLYSGFSRGGEVIGRCFLDEVTGSYSIRGERRWL